MLDGRRRPHPQSKYGVFFASFFCFTIRGLFYVSAEVMKCVLWCFPALWIVFADSHMSCHFILLTTEYAVAVPLSFLFSFSFRVQGFIEGLVEHRGFSPPVFIGEGDKDLACCCRGAFACRWELPSTAVDLLVHVPK